MIRPFIAAVIVFALWTAFIAWCGLGFDPSSWSAFERGAYVAIGLVLSALGVAARQELRHD